MKELLLAGRVVLGIAIFAFFLNIIAIVLSFIQAKYVLASVGSFAAGIVFCVILRMLEIISEVKRNILK